MDGCNAASAIKLSSFFSSSPRNVCHVLQMRACQRLKITFLPLKYTTETERQQQWQRKGDTPPTAKKVTNFVMPSGSNLTSTMQTNELASPLNRMRSLFALCLASSCFSVVSRQMGGAKTIAVNHTCIKVVATTHARCTMLLLLPKNIVAMPAPQPVCVCQTRVQ